MKIVQNNWKIEGEHEKYAPKFVRVEVPQADIRVKWISYTRLRDLSTSSSNNFLGLSLMNNSELVVYNYHIPSIA